MEQTKDIRNLFKVIFPPKLQILSKDLRKRLRQKYYIIETVDETSGFALIHYHNGIYHLDYLGVNPTIQGKGIGTKLLTTVIKKYKKISLECEKNLVPYYSKFGFIDSKLEYSWHHQKMHLIVQTNDYLRNHGTIKIFTTSINFMVLFFDHCYQSCSSSTRTDCSLSMV